MEGTIRRSQVAQDPSQVWLSVLIIVILCVAAYLAYHFTMRDESADQANALAQTFIRSSPVIQTDLGKVTAMKEISENHVTGAKPFWAVDYDVASGQKSGEAEFKMTKAEGLWSVPSAQLKMDHQPMINLR